MAGFDAGGTGIGDRSSYEGATLAATQAAVETYFTGCARCPRSRCYHDRDRLRRVREEKQVQTEVPAAGN